MDDVSHVDRLEDLRSSYRRVLRARRPPVDDRRTRSRRSTDGGATVRMFGVDTAVTDARAWSGSRAWLFVGNETRTA